MTGALVLASGTGAAIASTPVPAVSHAAPAAKPAVPHVMTIMMENTDYGQMAGSPAMPYFNQLMHQYAGFTRAYGWAHPSLPNYLELLAGSTLGVTNDCDITDPGCSNFTHQRLINQLAAAGIPWHYYQQGDASGCDQSHGGGNYEYWINPFRYFADFATQCQHISSFDSLLPDLSSKSAPDFAWLTPDGVNDGGDSGTMASGDSWLNAQLPQIMKTSWYRQGGQIVILYDEGYRNSDTYGGATGGHIPMVVVSAHTRGMGLITRPVNTAGVLRSIEHAYGLGYIGDAASTSNGSLGGALVAGRPTGPPAHQLSRGAVVTTTGHRTETVQTAGHDTLAFNGVYRSGNGSTIQVGENTSGEGVIDTKQHRAIAVPGTSSLESVSCTTATRCYAVGLGALNTDEAVLVSITNGRPTHSTPLPTFIGLYGISCPTATTCEAAGYDNATGGDAVTTITNGVASAPADVADGGEWLNAISCPTATKCYAVGLVNYLPSIIPITSGTPGTPMTIPDAWYVSGIDCTTPGNCVAVGQSKDDPGRGTVTTLVNGAIGTTHVVPGTGYLYGVGCAPDGSCLLAGASKADAGGYSHGVLSDYVDGSAPSSRSVTGTNGLGQVACGVSTDDCTTIGAVLHS
jgi:hypothetical protein